MCVTVSVHVFCGCVWMCEGLHSKMLNFFFYHFLRFVQFWISGICCSYCSHSVFTAPFCFLNSGPFSGKTQTFSKGGWIAHFGMKSSFCSFVPSHSPAVSLLSNKVHSECHNATDPFLDWYLFICLFISESLLLIDLPTIPCFLLF